jgi:hypothetical protein
MKSAQKIFIEKSRGMRPVEKPRPRNRDIIARQWVLEKKRVWMYEIHISAKN